MPSSSPSSSPSSTGDLPVGDVVTTTQGPDLKCGDFFQKGKKYTIMTATHYFTGTVVDVTATSVSINNAELIFQMGTPSKYLLGQKAEEADKIPTTILVFFHGMICAFPHV